MMNLSPFTILLVIAVYFTLLIIIARLTSGKGDNQTFFNANKSSPWLLVAVGMIGASLSGVTFVSIPGVIGKTGGLNSNFSYMQMVFGYLLGYLLIALILLPIYYKYQVTSIYSYLEQRLGYSSYKVGAAYFILSRVIGASFRLYLVSMIIDLFVTGPMGVPFFVTVCITILLIWIYTFQGGIQTIVVTDTFQTVSMLTAVVLTVLGICSAMDISLFQAFDLIHDEGYAQIFYFENGWSDPNNFYKQFLSGALIALVMTGLDQDMMQKNLTCRSLIDAQKNIATFSTILIFANLLFLTLGALLYIYAAHTQLAIPERTDQLYPTIALQYLPTEVGIFFVLGLIAAAYSSADSALTSLTTSFCVDFLDMDKKEQKADSKTRVKVHIGFSVLLLIVILLFNAINNDAVINGLFKAAGYTYGPILGLFSFAILTKRVIQKDWVIAICLAAPILTFLIDKYSDVILNGFKLGFLLLALNGILTFIGLLIISKNEAR